MGSSKKKERRQDNAILNQFYIESEGGKALLRDLPEVKKILETLGEPFKEVLPDRELFYFFLIFAWNLSFLGEEKANEEITLFLKQYESGGPRFIQAAKKLLVDIALMKRKRFPDERYIFASL